MSNENRFQPGFEYTLMDGGRIQVYSVCGTLIEGRRLPPGSEEPVHFCLFQDRLSTVGEPVDRRVDPAKEYVTRAGKPVRILSTDLKGDKPIVAAILKQYGLEAVLSYYANGTQFIGSSDKDDLVEVPPVSFEPDEVVEALIFGYWMRAHYRSPVGSEGHTVWREGRSSKTALSDQDHWGVSPEEIRKLK